MDSKQLYRYSPVDWMEGRHVSLRLVEKQVPRLGCSKGLYYYSLLGLVKCQSRDLCCLELGLMLALRS